MPSIAAVRGLPSPPAVRGPLRRLRHVSEPWWVVSAIAFFVIVTFWWIAVDRQVPDFDEGNHLIYAFTVRNELSSGQLTAPFTNFNNYPPLVHLIGAIGLLIAGLHEAAVLIAQSLFFVPMVAGGCYAAGTAAYGRRAGLLAALFALFSPMWISEMHEYYVDPGEAAMVAASVGAILASRRFQRLGVAALAGFLCSLGMLSKQTFPLFVAGLVAVVIVRGGWRNWRGMIAFVAGGAPLTLPWYIYHYGQLKQLYLGATTAISIASGNANAGNGITPPRYSPRNFAWYLWNLFNHQLLAPLTLFFLVGTALALWRFARRRDPEDLTPELVIGGFVGYLGITWIVLKDPRYSLPALVYLAVLGTGWVAQARLPLRRWLTGALGLVLAANFAMVSFGWGSPLTLTFPGAPSPSVNGARVVTFFSPLGYLHGGPVQDGDVLGLLRSLQRMHFRYVDFDGGSANIPDFNLNGLGALSIIAGIPEPPGGLGTMGPNDVFLLRHIPGRGDPPPCQRLLDGSGIYVEVGNPLAAPFEAYKLVCPGRKHPYYRRTAPYSEDITGVISGPPRKPLLKLFRSLHRHGVNTVQYDTSMKGYYDGEQYMDNVGLQKLAASVGVQTGAYDPAGNGAHEGFLIDHIPAPGDPPPCVKLFDGSGVYVVLGNALVPFSDYTFYCPLRKPHLYRR
jgi:Dolichyl-phosphate-mannose-protein mannosyltransferase